jgi:hypothetical protein
MKNKATGKPSPKTFSTWVEQRDLIKINSSLSTARRILVTVDLYLRPR